jgi:hypothetical protein
MPGEISIATKTLRNRVAELESKLAMSELKWQTGGPPYDDKPYWYRCTRAASERYWTKPRIMLGRHFINYKDMRHQYAGPLEPPADEPKEERG